MTKPLDILIVEDSSDDAELMIIGLSKERFIFNWRRVDNEYDYLAELKSPPDLILADWSLPRFNGLRALRLLRDLKLDIPFIIVSGSIGEDVAIDAIRQGAHDYVLKDRTARLGPAVRNALEDKRLREERERSEEKLRESEEKYRMVVENASDAICITVNGHISFINDRQLLHITGYEKKEIEIKPFFSIIHPEDLPDVLERRNRRMKGENIPSVNHFRIIAKDGGTRWVEANAILFEWDKKKAELSFLKDITDKKISEMEVQKTLDSLKKAFSTIVQVMVSAVEARDPYTAGHQKRTADLARAIAVEMGLPHEKVDGIRMAGSIHDIGKLSIPADILSRPSRLTDIEFSLIKEHSRQGYEILKDVESPWPLAQIVYQHHERMNGSGYPRNLKGEEILMEARIMAVADVVESMASHRPYRPALGIESALAEIEKNKGILYDNAVADTCLRLFQDKGFKLERT